MYPIESILRDSALRYILKCDVPKESRYEAEQMFAHEIDLFIAGARCAFKMVIDNNLLDKEGK